MTRYCDDLYQLQLLYTPHLMKVLSCSQMTGQVDSILEAMHVMVTAASKKHSSIIASVLGDHIIILLHLIHQQVCLITHCECDVERLSKPSTAWTINSIPLQKINSKG